MRVPALCSLFGVAALARSISSFPGANPSIDTRTLDEIYEAAQKESGELVVMFGGDSPDQGQSTIDAWNARFPKVKLNLTVELSKYIDSRIDRQFQKTGTDGADIAVLQQLNDFDRWTRWGRLLPYKPAAWNNIYPDVKDPNGAFVSILFYQFGQFVYNKDRVKESELPSSYEDLLNPCWKDKLIIAYPNDDDALNYLFTLIINRYGWEWFEELVSRQNVRWIRGTGVALEYLTKGNTSAVLSITTNIVDQTNLGSKIPTDTRLAWPQAAAILRTTPRPESAKLFMSWIISDDFQQSLANSSVFYTTRMDIKDSKGDIWRTATAPPTEYSKWIVNREVVEWWRFQYESNLGPPQGVDPIFIGP
ncbi:ABC transporter substrate binding protein-like protein [Xylogone sp. PMI_703]|nr:ABC transporter substrate binding protein-like protein [Xylogone sp. PMI_703]